jgi:DNA-binding response OmpR family regulator
MKILLIEDDREMAQSLRAALKDLFVVEIASTAEEGEYFARLGTFDLIVLDIILPDTNGIDLCKSLRAQKVSVPILMLTGEAKFDEKLRAFANGADDYLLKPFQLDELLARMRALLRRPKSFPADIISLADLTIDMAKKRVFRRDQAIPLRRKEYLILEYLMRNIGKVITREALLDHVWEMSDDTNGNVVDVHIKYLRDSVDRNYPKKLIKTVHGLGYKIDA